MRSWWPTSCVAWQRSGAVSVRGAAPKLVAVKQFLSDEEVEEFLAMATSHPATFAGATQTLRLLDFEETELVKDVEARRNRAKPRESGDSLVRPGWWPLAVYR